MTQQPDFIERITIALERIAETLDKIEGRLADCMTATATFKNLGRRLVLSLV